VRSPWATRPPHLKLTRRPDQGTAGPLQDQDGKGRTVRAAYERHESIWDMGGLVRLGQPLRFARMGVLPA
jgi:hypothetical protein